MVIGGKVPVAGALVWAATGVRHGAGHRVCHQENAKRGRRTTPTAAAIPTLAPQRRARGEGDRAAPRKTHKTEQRAEGMPAAMQRRGRPRAQQRQRGWPRGRNERGPQRPRQPPDRVAAASAAKTDSQELKSGTHGALAPAMHPPHRLLPPRLGHSRQEQTRGGP